MQVFGCAQAKSKSPYPACSSTERRLGLLKVRLGVSSGAGMLNTSILYAFQFHVSSIPALVLEPLRAEARHPSALQAQQEGLS